MLLRLEYRSKRHSPIIFVVYTDFIRMGNVIFPNANHCSYSSRDLPQYQIFILNIVKIEIWR